MTAWDFERHTVNSKWADQVMSRPEVGEELLGQVLPQPILHTWHSSYTLFMFKACVNHCDCCIGLRKCNAGYYCRQPFLTWGYLKWLNYTTRRLVKQDYKQAACLLPVWSVFEKNCLLQNEQCFSVPAASCYVIVISKSWPRSVTLFICHWRDQLQNFETYVLRREVTFSQVEMWPSVFGRSHSKEYEKANIAAETIFMPCHYDNNGT